MTKTFHATFIMRLGNMMTSTLLRAGIRMGNMTLLTVRGRRSGLPRTTPVTLFEFDGKRYLISPYGSVNWVRNLRMASEAVLSRGRQSEAISTIELTYQEAAPVLKQMLAHAPSFIRAYFDVTPESSMQAFEHEAPQHPVFLLKLPGQTSEMPLEVAVAH